MRRAIAVAILFAGRAVRADSGTIENQAGGVAIGGALGLGLGVAIDDAVHGDAALDHPLYPVVGLELGAIAGAQLLGDSSGGTGQLWATSLGGLAGAGALVGLVVLADHVGEPWSTACVVAGFAAALAGPIVADQLDGNARAVVPLARVAF